MSDNVEKNWTKLFKISFANELLVKDLLRILVHMNVCHNMFGRNNVRSFH